MRKTEDIVEIKQQVYGFLNERLDVFKEALELFAKKWGMGVYPIDIDFKESLVEEEDEEYYEIGENQVLVTRRFGDFFDDDYGEDELDLKGYLDFDIFYEILQEETNIKIQEYPEEKENLNKLLENVRKTLFD